MRATTLRFPQNAPARPHPVDPTPLARELESLSVTFDGGKTTLNFAEAALLIQGSAVVYSRKVEYLYSLIYHALDVLNAKGACFAARAGRHAPRGLALTTNPPPPQPPTPPQHTRARAH